MYTQCPDCDTAFRVTAPDLQRAYGRVVCIGCSREFNALERLSEDLPAAAERADEKRAILESLNELTGPHEIRIEDTGVEWRVVEEDELAEEEPPPVDSEPDGGEDGSIRWYIADLADELASEDTTTPDDAVAETPDAGPGAGPESPEPNVSAPLERPLGERNMSNLQESLELPATVPDENVQRYDDNTPLPDDFVDEGEPPAPRRRAEDRIEPRSPEADEAQVDLGLGEPEEWMELLGEVGPTADDAVSPSADAAPADEAPEALSDVDPLADTDVRPVANDELSLDDGYPSDIDTQFDLQALELGIDLTGSRNLSLEDEGEVPDEPLELAADDAEGDVGETREQDLVTAKSLRDEQPLPTAPPATAVTDPAVRAAVVEAAEWPDPPESTARREDEEAAEERHRDEVFEQELAAAYSITLDDEVDAGSDDPDETGHFVPPATREEMTINMMIDQDLIRLAEQQNVFTSTAAHRKPEAASHVETIIMEGDFVRSILDGNEESSGDSAGAGGFDDPAGRMPAKRDEDDFLLQTYSRSTNRVRAGRRGTGPASYSVMAGVAVLGLVLAAQVVHAYRDTLATYPVFESTVGSVYRLLGAPVVPGWNVAEWHFEATSGSTGDTDDVLTISSRIANGSARPLPYPLLHVSLTDRWEEIIGSKVLEPTEYLDGSVDAAARVSPGEKFTAVVRVEAPAPEATGFKLNVCYPDSGDRVRCATEDFRE